MFYTLLVTYVIGGITFVPLLAFAVVVYALYAADPVEPDGSKPSRQPGDEKPALAPSNTATSRSATLKTWLTARRSFEALPSSYISLVRNLWDARSQRPRRAEDAYYAILKGSVLYLYEEEAMIECAAAINIARCDVAVFPNKDLLDGELFAKRNALRLCEHVTVPSTPIAESRSSLLSRPATPSDNALSRTTAPWYIFFRSVTVMEDWYLALLAAHDTAPSVPFPYAAQQALITSLDVLPDFIPTRWLNAFLGRLFLGVKGTTAIERWVIGRLMKKLSKVKKPSFLTNVVVRSFDAGDVPPVLSKPMLKELTTEGEASVGVDISYVAPPGREMRITLSATATISFPTTASFSLFSGRNKDKDVPKDGDKDKEGEKDKDGAKDTQRPYEVSLVLAVVLRRVEGNLLFKIKRPPSNRIWYAFTTMPHMEVSVEPVVSDRQVRWGMVLSVIEGKLKEIIQESVVLPYMDDIPFFDTTPYELRGGLFGDCFPTEGRDASATMAMTTEEKLTPTTTITTTTTSASITATGDRERGNAAINTGTGVSVGGMSRTLPVEVPADHGASDQANTRTGNGVEVRKRRTWFASREEDSSGDMDGERTDAADRDVVRQKTDDDVGIVNEDERGPMIKVSQNEDYTNGGEDQRLTSRENGSRALSMSEGSSSVQPSTVVIPDTGLPRSAPSPSSTMMPPSPTVSTSRTSSSSLSPRPASMNSPLSISPPPSATSSFFSSLKSRGAGMAEKQPVLKEAMRKWGAGVNWAAGLRRGDKDREGSTRERGRDADVDTADHGDVLRRSASSGGSPRGGYADLRRKVEWRERERERRENGNATPIDIPYAKRDAGDAGPSERRPPSFRSDTSSSSASSIRFSPPSSAPFLTPSAPRTTTELHTMNLPPLPSASESTTPPLQPYQTPERRASELRVLSPNLAFPLLVDDAHVVAPVPIRAQPKAATMTIPGIHESHKGDIMALGSESTGVGGIGVGATDGDGQHAKAGKAMQSMYKLLRGGGGAGEETHAHMGIAEAGDRRPASSPSLMTPPSTLSPTPPPLPPRSQKQPQTQTQPPQPPYTPPVSDVVDSLASSSASSSSWQGNAEFSPASRALKNVAQQDAARQPPPLPVRRVSHSPGLAQPLTPTLRTASSNLAVDTPADTVSSPLRSSSVSLVDSPSLLSISDLEMPSEEVRDLEIRPPRTLPSPPDEKARWKPPLPPRKNSNGVKVQESGVS